MKDMHSGSLIKAAFPPGNWLYRGDCLDLLRDLNGRHEPFIDLVYIDPPFNSERGYSVWVSNGDGESEQKQAFEDTWAGQEWSLELEALSRQGGISAKAADFVRTHYRHFHNDAAAGYLSTMASRICEIHKALKPTGSFYLHCDWHMSHSLKLLCDIIFGENNFRNEIVWFYHDTPGRATRDFPRKHDAIFRYAKSDKFLFNANAVSVPLKPESRERYKYVRKLGGRATEGGSKTGEGGKTPEDVWLIPSVKGNSDERVPERYPTQKPLVLAERIIAASSNKGDLIADFFCGCGTTIVAAERLGRRWIGCDISTLAISAIKTRLKDAKYQESDALFPKTIEGAKTLAARSALGFEDWIIRRCVRAEPNERTPQGGYDGSLPFFMPDGTLAECLFEVKSGAAGVGKLRDFVTAVNNRRAAMGVFICFAERVGNLKREAAKHGRIGGLADTPPKIQILTVEELLAGKQHEVPHPGR